MGFACIHWLIYMYINVRKIMCQETLTLFIMLMISNNVVGIHNSKYIKTRTYAEKEECLDVSFNRILMKIKTKSILRCSLKCSENTECRRFMFNTVEKMCVLYKAGENCPIAGGVNHEVCYRQKHVCDDIMCTRCPIGYYGDQCQNIIKDCSDGITRGVVPSIKSLTYLKPSDDIFEVLCNFKSSSGYTVIQYRSSRCRKLVFKRTWNEYASGFGNAYGSYWLGLKHVHNIIRQSSYSFELHIKACTMTTCMQCFYLLFDVENEYNNFTITIGSYIKDNNSALGNSLSPVNYSISGKPFSTYDRDYSGGCPDLRKGGAWWYLDAPTCLLGNPTGSPIELQWLNSNGELTDQVELKLRLKKLGL